VIVSITRSESLENGTQLILRHDMSHYGHDTRQNTGAGDTNWPGRNLN
jgi:hypothetical protein